MKLYFRILVAVTIVAVLWSLIPFESACGDLQQDVLRLHIRANSDSSSDQELKLYVRDKIINEISPLYNGANTKDDAVKITQQNIDYIKDVAQNAVYEKGYDYRVSVGIKNEFFDTRYYDDFTMPSGTYDSLLVEIGSGQGENWWCVMYPSLCVGAASKKNMSDNLNDNEYSVVTSNKFEFRFKIVEYYRKLTSFFS